MSHWPEEFRHGREPSVLNWCELMLRPEAWTDVGFIQAVADLYGVAALMHGVNDLSEVADMGLITPCNGVPACAVLELGCWHARHLVAIVDVQPDSRPPVGNNAAAPPGAGAMRSAGILLVGESQRLGYPAALLLRMRGRFTCEEEAHWLDPLARPTG